MSYRVLTQRTHLFALMAAMLLSQSAIEARMESLLNEQHRSSTGTSGSADDARPRGLCPYGCFLGNGYSFDRRGSILHRHQVPDITLLGLAVCERVMHAQAGTIRAEPREGGGSAFHITLPPLIEADVTMDI